MNLKDILSATVVLFSVIDILGSIPVIITLKDQGKIIESSKATLVAGVLMIVFMFGGEYLLSLLGVDIHSFAIAGGILIFLLGLEMVLGRNIFKDNPDHAVATVVPLAFPLIAGAGTMTTILSLKAEYSNLSISIAILINLVIIYLVLHYSGWVKDKIGDSGVYIMRKSFGIILIAIAIKLIKGNLLL
ncbi:MAG: MarC family protein [Saprospiraceae bacterium]|nr:MarC family protein [Saprospiraceae bacterium]